MRILGMDTATAATAVALLDTDTDDVLAERDDPPAGARPRHSAQLLALAEAVLVRADVDWGGVDEIAVGVGPGTFTGIRIGVATARGLAQARAIPLVGISTLRALAHGLADDAGRLGRGALAVIDARRGEVFVAGWAVAGGRLSGEPLITPRAIAPAQLIRLLAADGRDWLAAGDGAVGFRQDLERSGAAVPTGDSALHRVSAIDHCRLAIGISPQRPDQVLPEYLRLPDAELALRERERAATTR